METEVLVFDQSFDSSHQEIFEVIQDFHNKLTTIYPNVVIEVEHQKREGKEYRILRFLESMPWGTPDVYYGHIEIVPMYFYHDTPLVIRLYCSHPKYLTIWGGLGNSFRSKLKVSDGIEGLSTTPWTLIPDNGSDRKILELFCKDYDFESIAKRVGYAVQTVYNKLGKLRKKYGEKLVPYRIKYSVKK